MGGFNDYTSVWTVRMLTTKYFLFLLKKSYLTDGINSFK